MESQFEILCDDPYGSNLTRALDKVSTQTINTIQERRMDLTLNNMNLMPAVFFNRITGDERTMYQSQLEYADTNTLTAVLSKHTKSR